MPVNRFFPVIALAAMLAVPCAASAQAIGSPEPDSSTPMISGHHGRHHGKSFMHALRALNLTDAQKKQVATFHTQEQQANANADDATKKANAAKMREQITGILTPDQQTRLASEMHHSRRPHTGMSDPRPMASPTP